MKTDTIGEEREHEALVYICTEMAQEARRKADDAFRYAMDLDDDAFARSEAYAEAFVAALTYAACARSLGKVLAAGADQ